MASPPPVKGAPYDTRLDAGVSDTIVPNYFIDVKELLLDGTRSKGYRRGKKKDEKLGMADLGILFITHATKSYCPHKAA